ncbi:MAG: hypothetical protein ACUVV0_13220 [Anaerolineae bacterium]
MSNAISLEGGSDWIDAILFVEIGVVEVASALAKRWRAGDIANEEREAALAAFLRESVERYQVLEIIGS